MKPTDSENRTALRKTFRQRRAALTASQQQRHGVAALEKLQRLVARYPVKRVGLYLSTAEELDTAPILEWLLDRNVIVGLPAITDSAAGTMVFREQQTGAPKHRGRFGLLEPVATAPELSIATFDLLLMPLVAFDDQGQRLGMGGGYYDRALGSQAARARPLLIGLAHSVQHSAHPLPSATWDVPLDAVVTEQSLLLYSPRARAAME